ncbi:MAG: hypothetical protein K2N87_00010 [Eubacterium sp.]|nr:hypothetical protein [Eubacterium sp.]
MTTKLNLVMTYPTHWDLQHIMEDYIQNFYDVLGPDEFKNGFYYEYQQETKMLRMRSKKGFHVKWLKYIGVSTKRKGNSEHPTAGKFGEGFKIASLCAYRDYQISVHMESLDWALDVMKTPGSIDGQRVEFLAYDMKKRKSKKDAILVLGNIDEGAYQVFLAAMNSFFYSENPLFGECIAQERCYSVYRANNALDGKVFVSLQKRADIYRIPLIFCNHNYKNFMEDDRDREFFSDYDTQNAVEEIVRKLSGEALKDVFFAFRYYWRDSKGNKKYGLDWKRVIMSLIFRIKEEKALLQDICETLQGNFIADMSPYEVRLDRNRYHTAIAWFRRSGFYGNCTILPHYFSDLGMKTLYSLCEEHEGFHVTHKPDTQQKRRIQVLEQMAANIFGDLLCYEKLPECRVIINEETPHAGFASATKTDGSAKNVLGMKVVYHISEVNLREKLFRTNAFPQAMTVYMHELLHQYGADASRQFRTAILAMDYRIMEKGRELEAYEKEWQK